MFFPRFSMGWIENTLDRYLGGVPLVFVLAIWRRLCRFARLWREAIFAFKEDRAIQKAASLAYQTILAIVPIFTVAFMILNAFTDLGGEGSPVVAYLSRHLIPVSPEDIVGNIAEFSRRISVGAIGWVGVGVLILVSVLLLDTVEAAINSIWNVSRRRPFIFRFIMYYALLTLGPIFFMISFFQTARLQVWLPEGMEQSIPDYLAPIGITWLGLVFSYKLFPYTTVRWKSVFLGALVGAVLFEMAKGGFNVYVTAFLLRPYARIYGAIALFPVFLVWIFVAWNVMLFGAEVSYVHQHLDRIMKEKALLRRHGLRRQDFLMLANDRMALRALTMVGERFVKGLDPLSDEDLAQVMGVPVELVQAMMGRLSHFKVVMAREDGDDGTVVYLPARPLQDILIGEVLADYRGTELGDRVESPERIQLGRLEQAIQEVMKGVSLERTVSPVQVEQPGEGIG